MLDMVDEARQMACRVVGVFQSSYDALRSSAGSSISAARGAPATAPAAGQSKDTARETGSLLLFCRWIKG
jgi:hypothetical protein